MGIKLIRKNNSESVTAYQDSVMFHLLKGVNGVIPNVGLQFNVTFNPSTKVLSVGSGMGIVYGRQFEIPIGQTVDFDLTSAPPYLSVYAEIDLRDPVAEKAELKMYSNANNFTNLSEGDNLISTPTGFAKMPMYNILYLGNALTLITTRFKVLNFDRIRDADSVNDIIFKNDDKGIKTIIGGAENSYIERKQVVFESVSGLSIAQGSSLSLTENIAPGDVYEFELTSDLTFKSNINFVRVKIGSPRPNPYLTLVNLGWLIATDADFETFRINLAYANKIFTVHGLKRTVNFVTNMPNPEIIVYRVYKIRGASL